MHCKPATRGRNSVVLAIPYAWQEHLQADEKIGHRVFKTEIPLSSQSDSSAKSFYQVSNYDVYHVKTLTSWGGSKSIPKIGHHFRRWHLVKKWLSYKTFFRTNGTFEKWVVVGLMRLNLQESNYNSRGENKREIMPMLEFLSLLCSKQEVVIRLLCSKGEVVVHLLCYKGWVVLCLLCSEGEVVFSPTSLSC